MSYKKCGENDWSEMGYGDRKCNACGTVDYSEDEVDFFARVGYVPADAKDDNESV